MDFLLLSRISLLINCPPDLSSVCLLITIALKEVIDVFILQQKCILCLLMSHFFESTNWSDCATLNVECPLPSIVDLPSTGAIQNISANKEVPLPLQVYRRRQKTNLPPMTEPSSSATANPPPTESDLPIALRKSTRSSTAHPISNFISYDSLHPIFRTFTLSISSESLSKNYQGHYYIQNERQPKMKK